jgi:Ca2+-binding RTX toxin-like protein
MRSTGVGVIGALTLALIALGFFAPAHAAPRCFGEAATIVGTGKPDRIRATSKADVIVTFGGSDHIHGRGGDDLVCSGGGGDTVRGGSGSDRVNAGEGSFDVVHGQGGNDDLLGAKGLDFLYGGAGDDRLSGGQDWDELYDNLGNDSIFGGPGHDIMEGGVGDDLYDGGPHGPIPEDWDPSTDGADRVDFLRSTPGVVVDLDVTTPQDTNEGVDTFVDVEELHGTNGNDVLKGNDDPAIGDTFFGRAGDDLVEGRSGDDLLIGDDGDDDLYGGAGDDELIGDGNAVIGPDNDFGDGGENKTTDPGDICLALEEFVGCETS